MADGEDHAVTTVERYDLRARLHPRPLLRQYELTARKIAVGCRQQEGRLQREYVLAVQILMKAVIVAVRLFEDERCRFRLTRLVAPFQKPDVVIRITDVDTHCHIPAIGDRGERRIER